MEVFNFLPNYTNYDKEIEEILGKDLVETNSIYYKKEFHDYRLEDTEKRPEESGVYMNHQIIMSRFLSSYTPYNGILVMHEPGTGKTCLSVAVIEKVRSESSYFKGALILMNNPNLIKNYKKELTETCTPGTYKIEDIDEITEIKLTERQKNIRINKKLSTYYQFETIETFSKNIISKLSDDELIKRYSNHIIIIDEAHHLRVTKDENNQYQYIHRLLHIIKNSKTILMTGTPMVDNASEIASLMNLILDKNHQLPTGNKFIEEYMIKINDVFVMNKDKIENFKELLYGKVSFLRSMQSTVKRTFIGRKLDLAHFNQYTLPLKDFQLKCYKEALTKDEEEKSDFYIKSRQASLFVFPGTDSIENGTYGDKGYNIYTKTVVNNANKTKKLIIKKDFFTNIFGDSTDHKEKLKKLENYSIKYATCINHLLTDKGNHFVYLDFVHGSGAFIFISLLEQFGFQNFKQSGSNPKYALLTSDTRSDIDNAIRIFNSDSNVEGQNIKVIVGTRIISEGFSLKNVQYVHILSPHWNFSNTDQAIARAFRLFSHEALLKIDKNLVIKIYLYTILTNKDPSNTDVKSIDRYMYKFCEDKDIAIKSVEHILKLISFDCKLNKERNRLSSVLDNSRNCEYKKCDYVCYDEKYHEEKYDIDLDLSTYHLYYDQPDINRLIKRLQIIFSKISKITFNELYAQLSDVQHILLIKTILYMNNHKIPVHIHEGINYFLYNENDILFLSTRLKDYESFDSFYVDHIPFQLEYNFNETIETIYNNYLVILFEQLKDETNETTKKMLFNRFHNKAKELLLEISILSRERKYQDVSSIREYIIKQLSDHITEEKQLIISNLLSDQLRCLTLPLEDKDNTKDNTKDNIWKNCEKNIKKPVKNAEVIKYDINEYGYIGLYKDDKFKIIIQQENKEDLKKKSSLNKGVVCTTIPKNILFDIIYKLNIEPDTSSETYNELNEDLDDDLEDKIKENEILKDFIDKDLSKDDMIRLLYWNTKTKPQICESIENAFKEKSLILIEKK